MVALLTGIGVIILGFAAYTMGVFEKVEVRERNVEEMILIYEDYEGPYKNTKVIQDRLYYRLLNDKGIETFRGFGIYYDNPKKVSRSKLRSKSGCILEEKDYEKVNELKMEFKIMALAKGQYVYSEFPLKSPLSVWGGIIKVYPKLNKYMKEKEYSEKEVMEIYDMPNKKIIFLVKK